MTMEYTKTPFLYFMHYLKMYKARVYGIMAGAVSFALFSRGMAYFFSRIIDVISLDGTRLNTVFIYLGIMLSMEILYIMARQVMVYLCHKTFPTMAAQVKEDGAFYVLHHSPRYLSNQPIGKIASKIGQLAGNVESMGWMIVWDFVMPSILALCTFCMLMMVNVWLGIIFVFWSSLLLEYMFFTGKKLSKYNEEVAEKMSTLSGYLIDMISNWSLVKSFARFKYEKERLMPVLTDARDADVNNGIRIETTRTIQYVIVTLFKISMLFLAIMLWIRKIITPGDIVLVMLLIIGLVDWFNGFV